jgi:hypothetical protein
VVVGGIFPAATNALLVAKEAFEEEVEEEQ